MFLTTILSVAEPLTVNFNVPLFVPEASVTPVSVPVLLTPVQVDGVVIVISVPSTVAIVAELPADAREALLFSTWFSPLIASQSAFVTEVPAVTVLFAIRKSPTSQALPA